MPFQKGVSGNPAGRPKGMLAALKARYGANGDKLMENLDLLAFSAEDETVRLQASKYLADQFWGKARETHDVVVSHVPLFGLPPGAFVAVETDGEAIEGGDDSVH